MFGENVQELIKLALQEDIGSGDITTDALIDPNLMAQASIVAREELVVCGNVIAEQVFLSVNPHLRYEIKKNDGEHAAKDEIIAEVSGQYKAIITAERVVLNFLQHLSGIATLTASVVSRVSHAKVLDTRKTMPGFRVLEKYAVRIGGGHNHRAGLYDAVLIKNNHIDVLGGDVAKAVRTAKKKNPDVTIEVEVRNWKELEAALTEEPDVILFDNMSPEEIKKAVVFSKAKCPSVKLEASGGITIDTINKYDDAGVDFISLGMLTHSAKASDISLRFKKTSS